MAKSHSIAQAKYDSTHCKYYTLKIVVWFVDTKNSVLREIVKKIAIIVRIAWHRQITQ